MKSRRAFIKTSSLGFLTPSVIHAASPNDSSRATAKSIVRHTGEGEIFIVRENTPITIPAGFEDFFRQIGTPKRLPFRAKPKEEIMRLANVQGMMYK